MPSGRHKRRLSFRATLSLCAASGLLLSLCFPPAGLWPLAWVALVPWILALRAGSAAGAVVGSWLGGAVFFGALLYWLRLFGVSVWLLAALLEGMTLMVWGLLVRWNGRLGPAARILGAATLWCGVEWLRGLGQFGFTWGGLGYSQSPVLSMLAIARLLGAGGISLVIVLVNAAAAEAVLGVRQGERPLRGAARTMAFCMLCGLLALGAHTWRGRLPAAAGARLRVTVLQGSAHGPLSASQVNAPLTPRQQRETLRIYQSLTEQAAREDPALIVWPESAIPGAPASEVWIAERLARIARGSGAWLLAGGPYLDDKGRTFNSAYLYSPIGNLVARYDKVHLVPFGEYVPWRSRLPFLERYHVREFDFSAGGAHRVLQAGAAAVGPMICFESIFPQISWQLAQRGADVLVVITNDGWFGETAAAAQHRQIAVLRAAETGRWVLRAASSGISAVITPDGRVLQECGLFERGMLSAEVGLGDTGPAGPRFGPAFAWLMVALSAACVIAPAALGREGRGTRGGLPRTRPRRRGRARSR